MADNTLMSPFNPGYSPQEEVKQDPAGLADQWRGFLADPASRAALMSFGAQLSQPIAPGNNWAGHIGQATGAAGEAATKAFSLEQGDIERESKQVLRESQANAATSRAETAQANADTAATRVQAYSDRVASQNQLSDQQAQTQANRRRFLDAQSELLFQKAQTEPDKAKADMMRAEAAQMRAESTRVLSGARAEDIPLAAEDRRMRTEARTQDASTRQRAQEDRTILGTQAEERRSAQGGVRDAAQLRRDYNTYAQSITNANSRLLPGSQPQAVQPYEAWVKQFPENMRGAKPTGAPPPAQGGSPSQPQPGVQNISADSVLQQFPDARQEGDGNFYVVRNGRKFRVDP